MRAIAPVFVALTAACVLFALSGCGGERMDERTPLAQEQTERVVTEGEFEIVDTLEAGGTSFNPSLVRALADGDVLVYDAGSARVVRYDSTGSVVARYGSGVGSGPGEHRRVVDMGAFESGRVWSFDQQSGAVNVFEADGPFVRRIVPQDQSYFVAASSADRIVGVNPALEQPFRVYDSGGAQTGAFGWLLDEPGSDVVPYIGRVMLLASGGVAYVMQSADIIKAWDRDGSLLWHRMMIDGFEPPGVYREEDGSAFLEHPNGRSTITRLPMNVDDGRIHAFVVNSTAEIVFIDTYDAADGSYVGSRRVPVTQNACIPQFIRGTTAWMTCIGGTLVRARIPAL